MSTSRGVDGCSMRRSAILSGLICTALIAPAVAQEQDFSHITIEQIVAAWQARHEAVQSFECTIEETTVHLPGTLFGRDMRPTDDSGQPFPPEELTVHLHYRLVLDGIKVHVDRTGDNWVHRAERVQPDRLLRIADGERAVTFFGTEDRTDQVHPLAFIAPAVSEVTGIYPGTDHAVWPVFHALRSQATGRFWGPFDAAHWRISEKSGAIGGRPCLVVEHIESAASGLLHEIWVDPMQEFSAVRKLLGVVQLDITNMRDASGIWLPQEWTYLDAGRDDEGKAVLMSTQSFKVTGYALNSAIDNSLFQFEFPPGTEVTDETQVEAPTWRLVRDAGDREITETERLRGARYVDLMATTSGEALAPPNEWSLSWLWSSIVAACAVAGWLLIRRRG